MPAQPVNLTSVVTRFSTFELKAPCKVSLYARTVHVDGSADGLA